MLANGNSESIDVLLPAEIDVIARSAVAEVRNAAEQSGVEISITIPRDLPDVAANPHRLREAISAVIHVLIEHSRENSLIRLGARTYRDQVVITLENEGCGVELERVSSIRHANSRPPSTSTSRLSQLQEWLLLWGGDLRVDSRLDEGDRIRLELRQFNWSDVSYPAGVSQLPTEFAPPS